LKLLTSMRVGQKQKKIDINIPKLDDFIHKAYIHVARKIYKNVYLFEINIPPLQIQKNNRELEIIIQECILNTIRDSIPVESILKAYMDETVEEDVVEDIKEEIVEESNGQGETQFVNESTPVIEEPKTINSSLGTAGLSFNDLDSVRHFDNKEEMVSAPKNIERLEELSNLRNMQRKLEEEEETDSNMKLQIYDQSVELNNLDIQDINPQESNKEFVLDDIEILT